MKPQTVEYAVTRKNGIITRTGRTSIPKPNTSFAGGMIKWHEEKPKQKDD